MFSVADSKPFHPASHDVGSRRWRQRPAQPRDEDGPLSYNYPPAKEQAHATDVVSNDVVALATWYLPMTPVATV
jgi:hypothetical protein